MRPKEFVFTHRFSGYEIKDHIITVSLEDSPQPFPDVKIRMEGTHQGSLSLDKESARKLARTLLFLLGGELGT